jgi:hypothetical protein
MNSVTMHIFSEWVEREKEGGGDIQIHSKLEHTVIVTSVYLILMEFDTGGNHKKV